MHSASANSGLPAQVNTQQALRNSGVIGQQGSGPFQWKGVPCGVDVLTLLPWQVEQMRVQVGNEEEWVGRCGEHMSVFQSTTCTTWSIILEVLI